MLTGDDGSVPAKTQYLPKVKMADGTTQNAIQFSTALSCFGKSSYGSLVFHRATDTRATRVSEPSHPSVDNHHIC